jgi:phage/plasmid-associated DNA primase
MLKYIDGGRQLSPPEEVIRLQSNVVTDGSTALRWVEEFIDEGMLEIKPDEKDEYFLSVKDAYQRYQTWVVMAGEKHPLTMRFFKQDIEQHYSGLIKASGQYRFKGICVTPEFRRLHGGNGAAAIASGF